MSETTAPFRPVRDLRHVALAVRNFDQAVDFYTGTWGLEQTASDTGIAFLGAAGDPEQYVVRLRRSDQKGIDLISLAAHSAADVDQLAGNLIRAGVRIDREPGKLGTPGGGYGVRFFDPAGVLIEVSSDVAPKQYREIKERESIPGKLSHLVINTPHVEESKAFYEDHLGLRLSDWLGNVMCFLRSGSQHHILGIGRGAHTSVNHVSFELRGIDEYLRGTGRLARAGHPPLWGPGRHSPGDNTFSYFLDPNGNVVEYTTALEEIADDEAWQPRTFGFEPESQDQWGTAGPITQAMLKEQANDPDEVLWASSPV